MLRYLKKKAWHRLADELNGMGRTTRRGKAWSRTQVFRVLKRTAIHN